MQSFFVVLAALSYFKFSSKYRFFMFLVRYGAPFIYRCPEGRMTESGLTELDGKKLDVWCIGTLAIEIFTGMSLLKRFSTWDKRRLTSWYTQVYPIIQNSIRVWKNVFTFTIQFFMSLTVKE